MHYYPQGGEYGNDTSTTMQQLRNRSTRSLWDPAYVDQSWIATQVQLIPRLKSWTATHYPGTKIGITEYNWGAEGHINGATTQADILGIFGREGLDMATFWTFPPTSSPTYKAFKMYRNYDGNGGAFGDTSISATAPNPDSVSVFAAQRTSDGAVTIMAINKDLTTSPAVNIQLANVTPRAATQVVAPHGEQRDQSPVRPAGFRHHDLDDATGAEHHALRRAGVHDHAADAAAGAADKCANSHGPGHIHGSAVRCGRPDEFGGGTFVKRTLIVAVTAILAALNLTLTVGRAAGPPATIAVWTGAPQSAPINNNYGVLLVAVVRDSGGNGSQGATVTFSAPTSGPSGTFNGASSAAVITDSNGLAVAPTLRANGTAGGYVVSATVSGVAGSAQFSMSNTGSSGGTLTAPAAPVNVHVVGASGSPTPPPPTPPPPTPPPPANGTWVNVTPSNVNLSSDLDCGNFGTITIVADPNRPSDIYTSFNCQGIWKSTNYGQTWTGPINTGSGGAGASGAGGIAIAPGPAGQPPILYSAGIRGSGMGFWKSTDGGVSWTKYVVGPGGSRQDFYPPEVDPYNANNLLMAGHEMNMLVRSTDGGRTWSSVPMAGGMNQPGGTAYVTFINTGNAASTATTWLYSGQAAGGGVGTWRTANAGASWTKVDNNEHPHGQVQYYQPGNGVVYMAGVYSDLGWGVLRSSDYGQTWTHVGSSANQAAVFGTPNRVYSMWSWACGHCNTDPVAQSAPVPGISGWTAMTTPSNMTSGAAQAAVVYDGSRYVIVTANWLAGLWRYVEQ